MTAMNPGGPFVSTHRDPAGAGGIAPGATEAAERLQKSTRHAEWAMVPLAPGGTDSIAAWVVYPEVKRQRTGGGRGARDLRTLHVGPRSVADQLAADGFIAIAPDLLSIERGGATTDTLTTTSRAP